MRVDALQRDDLGLAGANLVMQHPCACASGGWLWIIYIHSLVTELVAQFCH